jgi:glycosyltransferase involved in cell wall biosynthesis
MMNSIGDTPRVKWLGRQPSDDIPRYLNTLDYLVLPRQTLVPIHYYCPLKLLEALACGVTCLAAPQGDIPRILDEGRLGRLIDTHDAKDWVKILREEMTHPHLAFQRSNAVADYVSTNFTWRVTASAIEDVLESVVSKRNLDNRSMYKASYRPSP